MSVTLGVEVYWATDIGRPRNGMFVVESGRLWIEIERESLIQESRRS
ncbi:MAG: hypothetical protein O7D29_00020 [Gemmatimonadetes bacterium]|nr:hypothetical protein [Gemmatimonadota bacterium]